MCYLFSSTSLSGNGHLPVNRMIEFLGNTSLITNVSYHADSVNPKHQQPDGNLDSNAKSQLLQMIGFIQSGGNAQATNATYDFSWLGDLDSNQD